VLNSGGILKTKTASNHTVGQALRPQSGCFLANLNAVL
jgi:hypothetical protein